MLILIVTSLYFILLVLKKIKCSGSCKNINDPYAKLCVPDVSKNWSKTCETIHIKWPEMCKYKCRLDANFCNNKQWWNEDKCRCECKELIDKGTCDKGLL